MNVLILLKSVKRSRLRTNVCKDKKESNNLIAIAMEAVDPN